MRVALTGTPGTGKTSISEKLEGFSIVHLTEYMKERDIGEERIELEVRPERLRKAVNNDFEDEEDVIFEGHLAHHLDVDYCIVLRCEPDELLERLKKRDYSPEKVHQNVESETIDIVLQEAVQKQERVKEIDTTGNSVKESAELVQKAVESKETGYGDIDWTDSI